MLDTHAWRANRKMYIQRVMQPDSAPSSRPPVAGVGRNVVALGLVSFFTDVSSEMIYPLLPVFLTTVLGASAGTLGAIEGAAESTAALLKLASGWWSDRVRRRKPLVVAGYVLAGAVRPLVAAATATWHVLAVRLTDRVGKGIRTSPRDALIADSVAPGIRGRAFGFQRAADNAGAVLGPLIAFALLQWVGLPIRPVFWLAFIPSVLALVTLIAFVRDVPATEPPPEHVGVPASTRLPGRFVAYLGVVLLFTLGSSSDAFLLLRAQQLGVSVALLPIIWATLSLVRTLATTHGGALSDRIGRIPTLVVGWVIYALVYVAFALASAQWHAWLLFAIYGLFYAFTEGAERALVVDLVPGARRGVAFGWFNLMIGVGALPASVLFGIVWDRWGAPTAFTMGAAFAAAATIGILFLPRAPRPAA
jgi:MFS family permease